MDKSPRLQKLESMLANDPEDSFLLYGVAIEYVKQGDTEIGVEKLAQLTEKDPDYQAAYFQLGQILADQGETEQAKVWLTNGIDAAKRVGNAHAAEEMTGFLEMLGG